MCDRFLRWIGVRPRLASDAEWELRWRLATVAQDALGIQTALMTDLERARSARSGRHRFPLPDPEVRETRNATLKAIGAAVVCIEGATRSALSRLRQNTRSQSCFMGISTAVLRSEHSHRVELTWTDEDGKMQRRPAGEDWVG